MLQFDIMCESAGKCRTKCISSGDDVCLENVCRNGDRVVKSVTACVATAVHASKERDPVARILM